MPKRREKNKYRKKTTTLPVSKHVSSPKKWQTKKNCMNKETLNQKQDHVCLTLAPRHSYQIASLPASNKEKKDYVKLLAEIQSQDE